LQGFDFPGNVRQLENICHWLTVMAPAQVVRHGGRPCAGRAARRAGAGRGIGADAGSRLGTTWRSTPASSRVRGRLIQTALSLTRGRRIEAAQRLGIGRNTITRKIQELGLDE
jgi:two-component system nitrogen regulation response regulator GlnG